MVYTYFRSKIENYLITLRESAFPIDQQDSYKPDNETLYRTNRELGKIIQGFYKTRYGFLHKKRILHKGKEKAEDARKKLAALNAFLVVDLAKKYQNRGISLIDLIGEGNIGLMIATKRWDPDHKPQKYPNGIKFSTYSRFWIKQSIRKAFLDSLRRNLTIPKNVCSNRGKIFHLISALEEELGEEPSDRQVAERFNQVYSSNGRCYQIKPEHVKAIKTTKTALKIITRINSDGEYDEYRDKKYDHYQELNSVTPDKLAIDRDSLESISNIVNRELNENERRVITLRFGLNGTSPMKLREIGDIIGLTRERVRQILKNSLTKLRPYLLKFDAA